jgi:hypothetical protein
VKHYHSSDPAKNVQYHARVLGELETFLASRDGSAAPTITEAAVMSDPEVTQFAAARMPATGGERVLYSGEGSQTAVLPELGSAEFSPEQAVAASTPDTSPPRTSLPLTMAIPALTASADREMAPDLDKAVKERQPFIARNWDKVEQFRLMLSREAS